ncbi:hypothetical protein HQQ94_17890 [Shewanella sp. VB17]|uniref:polysaccharide biosynthesis C-terminal domain-containing protein n=1 Tax=Shewanella sp. VB17 TaxID=2739432 RepID=UPI0015643174|nr:hypothetical protein [Shewanella sp. VB17]NRD75053.1 hypothetical protein [Shewanella sp. VB17]
MLTVKKFEKIGEDERGKTCCFNVKDYGAFIYITRFEGVLSGNSYHQGLNLGTKNKTFVLLSGAILLKYRKVGETDVHSLEVREPSVIEIEPFTVHNILAQTDIVILENNSLEDIKNDVVREQV